MDYKEIEALLLELRQRFEDHHHTGLDSLPVENTLANQGSLTAKSNATVTATYGVDEQAVIVNNRTRIEEIENALIALGVLT